MEETFPPFPSIIIFEYQLKDGIRCWVCPNLAVCDNMDSWVDRAQNVELETEGWPLETVLSFLVWPWAENFAQENFVLFKLSGKKEVESSLIVSAEVLWDSTG